jgi:outer membrane biosynthesis protein TonB
MALIFVKGLPYFIPQAESFPSFEAIGESIIDVENLEKALCTLPKPQIIALAKKLQIPHKTDTSSTIIAGRIVTKVCVMLMTHSRSTAVSTTASDSAPSEPKEPETKNEEPEEKPKETDENNEDEEKLNEPEKKNEEPEEKPNESDENNDNPNASAEAKANSSVLGVVPAPKPARKTTTKAKKQEEYTVDEMFQNLP